MKKHYVELGMAVLLLVCFYILSREAAETAGKLADVSGNIKNSQVILIDAGHGGVDSGMVGVNDLKEKGINLEISMKLKAILEKKGFAVVMKKGKELALSIQEQMNDQLSVARPRAAKGNRTYYLLKRSSGVINIVECGFLTNPDEAALLQSEEYQEKVANAVADGIGTYLEEQEVPEKN